MRRRTTTFLQVVTVFIGVGVLALLLWEPHIEGRNANATPKEIYFQDPFLAFVYVGSIPFFIALYQAFRLLGWVGSRHEERSDRAIAAARLIRSCMRVAIGFVVVGVVILMFVGEEKPPAAFMGLLATLSLLAMGAFATACERRVAGELDVKA